MGPAPRIAPPKFHPRLSPKNAEIASDLLGVDVGRGRGAHPSFFVRFLRLSDTLEPLKLAFSLPAEVNSRGAVDERIGNVHDGSHSGL